MNKHYSIRFLLLAALAKSYFDGLNTMMVTGTISNREVLRDKVMAPKDVLDVKVIHSDQLNRMFGGGTKAVRRRNRSVTLLIKRLWRVSGSSTIQATMMDAFIR